MPAFSFWNNAKTSDVKSAPAQTTAAVAQIDLNTENQDSGVFCFDQANLETSMKLISTAADDTESKTPMETESDRDSGVYLSDDERLPPSPKPSSSTSDEIHTKIPAPCPFPKPTTPTKPNSHGADAKIHRLRRPAELNLGPSLARASKPRSELEQRFDVFRDSKTQSKAALRSPTQLLKDRLNVPTWTERPDERSRTFKAPRMDESGCILPGPGAAMEAFSSTSVRAHTEANNRPAWWCRFDKLVVFDGIEVKEDGELAIHTRTSKGLSIARRLGDMETIIIPMNCEHFQEMLKRHEWKYDMRVCKRSVCKDCKERCKWEAAEAMKQCERAEANRDRADSVLQDGQMGEGEMMRRVGIEQGRLKSLVDGLDGIEERMKSALM